MTTLTDADGDALLALLDEECGATVDAVRGRFVPQRVSGGRHLSAQSLSEDLHRILRTLVRMGLFGDPVVTIQKELWRETDMSRKRGGALLDQAHEVLRDAADRVFAGLVARAALPAPRAIYTGVHHVPGARQAKMPGRIRFKGIPATLRVGVTVGGAFGAPTISADRVFAHRLRGEVLVRARDVADLRGNVLREWRTRPMTSDDCGYGPQAIDLAADLQHQLAGLDDVVALPALPVVLTRAAITGMDDLDLDLGLIDRDRELPGNDLNLVGRAMDRLVVGSLLLAACGETGLAHARVPSTWRIVLDGRHEPIDAASALRVLEGHTSSRTPVPALETVAEGPDWRIDQINGRVIDGRPHPTVPDATLILFHAIAAGGDVSSGGARTFLYICSRRIASDEDVERVVDALLPLHQPGDLSERFELCRANSALLPLECLKCSGRNAHTTAHFDRMRDVVNAGRLAGMLEGT